MDGRRFGVTLSVGSGLAGRTGAWPAGHPEYVAVPPACAPACPAGEDAGQWLAAAGEGDYERAWRIIMEVNPFPAVVGRVCQHPCQGACDRALVGEPVGINAVERFIGDEAIRQGWTVPAGPPTGRRVLVVGAGPAGLSAAYQLARLGHRVGVRDANPLPGGLMRYGIPRYRLPREVLDAEIYRIAALGVTLEPGRQVTNLRDDLAADGFEAAFVAVGAQLTGHPGVFGGGDIMAGDIVAAGQQTVTTAIGHGCRAAKAIDAYLRAASYPTRPPAAPATVDTVQDRVAAWSGT